MAERSNKFNPKLKYYHIILISIILSPLLILNSNSLNKQREKEKMLKSEEIILRKLYARKLDSSSDEDTFSKDTNKICDKGSEGLQNYYKNGDDKSIKIDDESISSENRPKYIDALIDLISGKGDSTENLKEYLIHIIPVLIFLVISILFLPGWLTCCICSCCDCCCCCCCKKPFCKIPFYIITLVIYILGIVISIYGLSQSNSIFVGLADTECSILKFIGEVFDGETKETKPKWIGIDNISTKFNEAKEQVDALQGSLVADLIDKKEAVKTKKDSFENEMILQSTNVATNKEDLSGLSESSLRGQYQLDIVQLFGDFSKTGDVVTYKEDTLMNWWYNEYIETATQSETYMEESTSNYDELSKNNGASSALNDGVEALKTIEDAFDNIKNKVSNILIDYSDIIDEYGKLAFKIAFSILMAMNVIIAVFITIEMFFSFLKANTRCLKCFLKSLIHIFWNILAIITFVTLLLGSAFIFLGTVGKDLISVVNFLVGEENLNSDETVLLDSAPSYLSKCISGDGNIVEDLNLDLHSLKNFDQLTNAYNELERAKIKADDLVKNKIAYNQYKSRYEEIVDYKIDNFNLISTSKALNFKNVLDTIHQNKQIDTWSISCGDNSHSCQSPRGASETDSFCIKPQTCNVDHTVYNWYSSSGNSVLIDYAKILDSFIHSISQIKSISTEEKSIKNALTSLDSKYEDFLKEEISTLTVYQTKIESLVKIFNDVIGEEGEITDIINCKFIGKNVKVVLKLLDNSLGKDFYTVGICLLVAGLAMCISISFTILLNIILDSLKNKADNNGIQELEVFGNNQNGEIGGYNPTNQYNNIYTGNINSENNGDRVISYNNNY